MKTSLPILLFFALVASVFAAEDDIKPTASIPHSPNIVCAMTVCPTASLSKRELACPSVCTDDCKIVEDPCCPGIEKAVCNNANSTDSPSGATPSTASSTASTGTSLPSSIASASPSASASVSDSSESSTPEATSPNQAGSNKAVLSTILFMALISVTLLI